MLGILLQSPQEALRAALRHPLNSCRLRAGGTCLQYIVSTIPEALPPQGFVSFTNLSCSMFTPYSLLPTSPLTLNISINLVYTQNIPYILYKYILELFYSLETHSLINNVQNCLISDVYNINKDYIVELNIWVL